MDHRASDFASTTTSLLKSACEHEVTEACADLAALVMAGRASPESGHSAAELLLLAAPRTITSPECGQDCPMFLAQSSRLAREKRRDEARVTARRLLAPLVRQGAFPADASGNVTHTLSIACEAHSPEFDAAVCVNVAVIDWTAGRDSDALKDLSGLIDAVCPPGGAKSAVDPLLCAKAREIVEARRAPPPAQTEPPSAAPSASAAPPLATTQVPAPSQTSAEAIVSSVRGPNVPSRTEPTVVAPRVAPAPTPVVTKLAPPNRAPRAPAIAASAPAPSAVVSARPPPPYFPPVKVTVGDQKAVKPIVRDEKSSQ
jgi:hypothetical protein